MSIDPPFPHIDLLAVDVERQSLLRQNAPAKMESLLRLIRTFRITLFNSASGIKYQVDVCCDNWWAEAQECRLLLGTTLPEVPPTPKGYDNHRHVQARLNKLETWLEKSIAVLESANEKPVIPPVEATKPIAVAPNPLKLPRDQSTTWEPCRSPIQRMILFMDVLAIALNRFHCLSETIEWQLLDPEYFELSRIIFPRHSNPPQVMQLLAIQASVEFGCDDDDTVHNARVWLIEASWVVPCGNDLREKFIAQRDLLSEYERKRHDLIVSLARVGRSIPQSIQDRKTLAIVQWNKTGEIQQQTLIQWLRDGVASEIPPAMAAETPTAERDAPAGVTEQLPVVATPTPATPGSSVVAAEGKEAKQNSQFIPLRGWDKILSALNEPHGKVIWKKDETTKDSIRKFNDEYNGPIVFPEGKGKHPTVSKLALMTWWGGLEEEFDRRTEELKAKAKSEQLTVADSHNYGAAGTVIPGISGSVKPSRATGEKGKEGKR